MASILRVDTLTDASSNNSTAMSTINQGTAKAWLQATNAAALSDSFNISGGTDNGTGDGTTTFSNNFDSADYSVSGMVGRQGASADPFLRFGDNSTAPTSSTVRLVCSGDNGTEYDVDRNSASAHGDLA